MSVLDFIRIHAYFSFASYLVIIYAMDSISLSHLEIDEIQMKFCERKIFDTKTWYQNINENPKRKINVKKKKKNKKIEEEEETIGVN